MSLVKKSAAEFIGTFWLVFGGCGSAVLAAGIPELGIGYAGVSLAFGLTVLTMAFAIGHISGCHLNPAVSLGLAVAGRFEFKELPAYVVAQVLGAIAAAWVLYWIASGAPGGYDLANGLAANGYGEHSPHGYSMQAGFGAEVVAVDHDVAGDHEAAAAKGPAAVESDQIGFRGAFGVPQLLAQGRLEKPVLHALAGGEDEGVAEGSRL